MAGTTGLEPATSAVTGQRSNQLSYVPRYISSVFRISFRPFMDTEGTPRIPTQRQK
jgi:hypothetical protein